MFSSFAVEDIKCKFKNLRTGFYREYKAVRASRGSNKPYLSKWKHYQQLLFLCECYDDGDSQDDPQILMSQEEEPPQPTTALHTKSVSLPLLIIAH